MGAGSIVRLLHRICSYGGSFYFQVTAQNLFLWWQFLLSGYCTEFVLMAQFLSSSYCTEFVHMAAGSIVRLLLRICSYDGSLYGKFTARKLFYGCCFCDEVAE